MILSKAITSSLSVLLVLAFIFFAAACTKAKQENSVQWKKVPLPDIHSQPLILSVAHVLNPRFKALSKQQLNSILQRSKILIKQHFDIDVQFKNAETLAIDEFFKYLKPSVMAGSRADIVDITLLNDASRARMVKSIADTLKNYKNDEQKVIDYAKPYLIKPYLVKGAEPKNISELSIALADTLLARLNFWHQIVADDGQPVLNNSEYNQWVWWDSMGYGEMPYDIVITNQLVASAENYGMDVHSSIRGGITAGTTTYSRRAQFGSYVYVMLYPMLNDNELLEKLRDDTAYSDEQITDYAAALLTHEVGHMLLHLGHPFGNASCIMSPTPLLKYRSWYQSLDAEKCKVGSEPQMQPGAAKLEYNVNW